MTDKQTDTPVAKSTPELHKDAPTSTSPDLVAVDRPGFDLGGSTGKTHAGSGIGIGPDASESRRDRRLPGRRGKSI